MSFSITIFSLSLVARMQIISKLIKAVVVAKILTLITYMLLDVDEGESQYIQFKRFTGYAILQEITNTTEKCENSKECVQKCKWDPLCTAFSAVNGPNREFAYSHKYGRVISVPMREATTFVKCMKNFFVLLYPSLFHQ